MCSLLHQSTNTHIINDFGLFEQTPSIERKEGTLKFLSNVPPQTNVTPSYTKCSISQIFGIKGQTFLLLEVGKMKLMNTIIYILVQFNEFSFLPILCRDYFWGGPQPGNNCIFFAFFFLKIFQSYSFLSHNITNHFGSQTKVCNFCSVKLIE